MTGLPSSHKKSHRPGCTAQPACTISEPVGRPGFGGLRSAALGYGQNPRYTCTHQPSRPQLHRLQIEPTAGVIPTLAGPIPSDTPLPPPIDPATPTAITIPSAAPLQLQPPLLAPAQPINLPPGFEIGVYASGLNGPRMLAIGPDGQLYAADRGANRIVRLPDLNGDGVADGIQVVADNLMRPSSLAFYNDGSLYVGETTRILRLSAPDARASSNSAR